MMFSSRGLSRLLVAAALLNSFSTLSPSVAARGVVLSRQTDLKGLRMELKSQLRSIEDQFAKLREQQQPREARRDVMMAPSPAGENLPVYEQHMDADPVYVPGNRESLRQWQAELSRRFARAAETVEQILKLNPPDEQELQERLETLRLYSQPVSSPDGRNVFGAGEVEQRARLMETPEAEYTPEARAAHARGEVRLRLVLAADGTVKHIFPIQSMRYGLTESAIEAARTIKFEPAMRNNVPASQFLTLVYDFKRRGATAPLVPRTIF